MHRSQPLHASVSIVTVPRTTTVLTRAPQPRPATPVRPGSQYRGWSTSADQAWDTIGGACTGPSATTIVASELPPRMTPPYTPNSITSRPSRTAARASTWAANCTPWPPMPVSSNSRSFINSVTNEEAYACNGLGVVVAADVRSATGQAKGSGGSAVG